MALAPSLAIELIGIPVPVRAATASPLPHAAKGPRRRLGEHPLHPFPDQLCLAATAGGREPAQALSLGIVDVNGGLMD